jgi:hypothetical protein
MGEEVVPLSLRDLQDKPSLLVWALPEITGESLGCSQKDETGASGGLPVKIEK